MELEWNNLINSLFRWIHVVAGILWIGLLYFFNWVNGPFAATMDGETKRRVVPELMPRALFWFRWAAIYTWVTGVVLLALVYYHGQLVWNDEQRLDPPLSPGVLLPVMLVGILLAAAVYDLLVKTVLRQPQAAFFGGWVVVGAVIYGLYAWGFSPRGYFIHTGGLFGTIMAFNVWMRIWPAQRGIIAATKSGQAPDAAAVALAGTRSRHNTYLSVPLVFMMLNEHVPVAYEWWLLWGCVLLGWVVVYLLYGKAKTVPGF